MTNPTKIRESRRIKKLVKYVIEFNQLIKRKNWYVRFSTTEVEVAGYYNTRSTRP